MDKIRESGNSALIIILLVVLILIPIIIAGTKITDAFHPIFMSSKIAPVDCVTQKCQTLPDGRILFQNGDVRLKNGITVVCGLCPNGPTDVLIPQSVLDKQIQDAIDKTQADFPSPFPTN